jgi:hypothetical protein
VKAYAGFIAQALDEWQELGFIPEEDRYRQGKTALLVKKVRPQLEIPGPLPIISSRMGGVLIAPHCE